MSYEPTNWKAGDTVTSAKLNKMEQGIAGGKNILIVSATVEGNLTMLDKTWQEIFDADIAFIVFYDEGYKDIQLVTEMEKTGAVYMLYSGDNDYHTQAADDYPVHSSGK